MPFSQCIICAKYYVDSKHNHINHINVLHPCQSPLSFLLFLKTWELFPPHTTCLCVYHIRATRFTIETKNVSEHAFWLFYSESSRFKISRVAHKEDINMTLQGATQKCYYSEHSSSFDAVNIQFLKRSTIFYREKQLRNATIHFSQTFKLYVKTCLDHQKIPGLLLEQKKKVKFSLIQIGIFYLNLKIIIFIWL